MSLGTAGVNAPGRTAPRPGGTAGAGDGVGASNRSDDARKVNDTDAGAGGEIGEAAGSTAAEPRCLRLLVVVDQFEELFTLCENEGDRRAFIRAIGAVSSGRDGEPPAAVVVPVMRADFFENCAAYPELADASREGQLVVGPMSRDEVREAVEMPAYIAGLALEPGVVELLLSDLGAADGRGHEPGALPLLSHALFETWQRRNGRVLTVGGYRDTGGIEGAIGQTAEAHGGRLAAVLDRLTTLDRTSSASTTAFTEEVRLVGIPPRQWLVMADGRRVGQSVVKKRTIVQIVNDPNTAAFIKASETQARRAALIRGDLIVALVVLLVLAISVAVPATIYSSRLSNVSDPLAGHTDLTESVAFSPDGKTLATGSSDGTALLWDLAKPIEPVGGRVWDFAVPTASIVEDACQVVGIGLNEDEWNYFFPDLPYEDSCAP